MDKNDNLFSFCIILLVIALFNVLQAEKKENTNPYSWMSPFDRIGHNKDMAKFGSTVMEKDDQEKMRQALREMGVKSPDKIPLKKLTKTNSEAETTSTGIWVNPDLSELKADHVRYREAKKYWDKNEDTVGGLSYSAISLVSAGYFINNLRLPGAVEGPKILTSVFLAVAAVSSGIKGWKERKNYKEVKKNQLKILQKLGV